MSRRKPLVPGKAEEPAQAAADSAAGVVVRLKPYSYIHVMDNNTNVSRVEIGPQVYTVEQHEKVILSETEFLIIPARSYAVIKNPVVTTADGKPVVGKHKAVTIAHGEEEIRFSRAPFPLYPGEQLVGKVEPLQVVGPQKALQLHCVRDFGDGANKRVAGEEYLFRGPGTYMPRVEEKIMSTINAVVIKQGEALRLRARNKCTDHSGEARRAGEEWLYTTAGPYLPNVDEEVVSTVRPVVLTATDALHLKSIKTFTDTFGVKRNAGAQWLVTDQQTERYLPGVHEEVVGHVQSTTLTGEQYAVVLDPVDAEGKPQLGKKSLRRGPATFFLQPGERLEDGIKDVILLGDNEALLLKATEAFEDHQPGDLWMVQGPRSYTPPVQVRIMERRKAISLSRNEGIYVRDISTGKVRLISGQRYLLTAQEELWEKPLPADVEQLLGRERVKTEAVTFRCPHNTAVRIYDYTTRKSRIVYGPNLVMLQPDEQITVWSLSGDEPKKPNHTKTLAINLGPEFMTDVFVVETSDHAKLRLKLAYYWHFAVDRKNEESSQKIFSVPDFVGDLVKAVAGRVRGAVASQSFDGFHKNSAEIIRSAVFGNDDRLLFPANSLVVTGVDVQSVEPVDQRTRDSLLNSVQKAIAITTKSQEARARHLARQQEQDAKGLLDGQRLVDDSLAEKARARLINLQTSTKIVEQTGEATAVAKASARSREVEGQTEVVVASLNAEVAKLRSTARLEGLKKKQDVEIEFQAKMDHEELRRESELAKIESDKFSQIVTAIDPATIKAIAQAGPEMQGRLLKGLGLKTVLISDGHSPLNLFSTANGLLAGE